MHNKTTPDAAAAALTTLMHALIDIECTAELAQNKGEKEYTAFCLECIRYISSRSLNEAKNILVADCENGGVMRDDRFNSLKREFDGAPEHTGDALLGVADMIKAAYFLINTSGYKSEGEMIL
ncbi:hypothetical protein CCS78_004865, partial [Escherichia coli]|nr:hypothetical protein [Escherichia coli]